MSQNQFKIPKREYSTFNLSHMHRTSLDMGKLVPVSTKVCMPGDTFTVSVDAFVRGMPTIAPILDKVDIKVNHFYVPYRVLWEKFQDFYTESNIHKGLGRPQPQMPVLGKATTIADPKYPSGRLADYLGVSKHWNNEGDSPALSAMPFIAYQKIFMDYYAPQRWVQYLNDSQTPHELAELNVFLEYQRRESNGGSLGTIGANTQWFEKLRSVNWNNDYLTNALPTPDLFDTSKVLMLNEEFNTGGAGFITRQYNQEQHELNQWEVDALGKTNYSKLATVRDLRKSIAVQHYYEQLSYGGGRYQETMNVLWGQNISDQTLQRSQYIGGDVMQLFVNEVEQTAETDQGGLGDLAGKPVGGGKTEHKTFTADEFGIYMAIVHVVPKRSYSDAMDKSLFFTTNRADLPAPHFEGIGDEAVHRYELTGKFFEDPNNRAAGIFGYVPRYSNYKSSLDRFSGEMRTTLLHWHMGSTADDLKNFTKITPEFLNCNPREDIFKVDEPDKLLGTFQINIKAKRKLSVNPMPGMSYI